MLLLNVTNVVAYYKCATRFPDSAVYIIIYIIFMTPKND